ncbi:helix-turn-helix transcriptional regulator [Streptomyces sp. NPDC006649]|uniref:helix-turn-helix transcriptional regulator n=1 Tax=Streptomyces sp. NPDC006649 TaxID=3156896 RepID=UPI0033BF368C
MAPSAALPQLAHFLRSRRARLTPEAVGLPRTSTRRLSGLRRAEVAALAGISPEYYTRLEQGRQHHPSSEGPGRARQRAPA